METYASSSSLLDEVIRLNLDILPPELKVHIFTQLDIVTIGRCSTICREWKDLIDDDKQHFWKELCFRDYLDFIDTKALQDSEAASSDRDSHYVSKLSSSMLHNPLFVQLAEAFDISDDEEEGNSGEESATSSNSPMMSSGEESPNSNSEEGSQSPNQVAEGDGNTREREKAMHTAFQSLCRKVKRARTQLEGGLVKTRKWKDFYRDCHSKPNLSGVWYGKYGGHGDEQVEVVQKGYLLSATKITGDANVPAGKQTWWMNLDHELKNGEGQIHLADTGYTNPRWGKATINIIDADHFNVTWSHLYWTFPLPFERASARQQRLTKQGSSESVEMHCPFRTDTEAS